MSYPDTLTADYLNHHLAILDGWQADAVDVIDDMDERTQTASERLAQAMTEEEREAAEALYWPVRDLLHNEARKVYDRMGPASHELAEPDVTGLSWLVFIRCLATYDSEETHLTTWLQVNARSIFRTYVLRVRDRSDTERHRRARRKVYQKEREMLTEEGREPTRREYADAVREVTGLEDWTCQRISRLVDYLTSDDMPRRLDRSITDDDSTTLHDITPDTSTERMDTEALGEELAAELDKEDLWHDLLKTDKSLLDS